MLLFLEWFFIYLLLELISLLVILWSNIIKCLISIKYLLVIYSFWIRNDTSHIDHVTIISHHILIIWLTYCLLILIEYIINLLLLIFISLWALLWYFIEFIFNRLLLKSFILDAFIEANIWVNVILVLPYFDFLCWFSYRVLLKSLLYILETLILLRLVGLLSEDRLLIVYWFLGIY